VERRRELYVSVCERKSISINNSDVFGQQFHFYTRFSYGTKQTYCVREKDETFRDVFSWMIEQNFSFPPLELFTRCKQGKEKF
jgi:hypothetical protein